jgi:hypothetical protein
MTEFRYGPVELYLVGFDDDGPDPATFDALTELIEQEVVHLIDLLVIRRRIDGAVDVLEIDDFDGFGLDVQDLAPTGIVGADDIEDFAASIPPGTAAALFVVELVYARRLANGLAASGGVVLRSERIPAPIVNAVVDLAASATHDRVPRESTPQRAHIDAAAQVAVARAAAAQTAAGADVPPASAAPPGAADDTVARQHRPPEGVTADARRDAASPLRPSPALVAWRDGSPSPA